MQTKTGLQANFKYKRHQAALNIGLYRENAIAIDSEANDSFGGNVYYVTMQITLPIPECTRNERNFHCDVLHITPDRVVTLVLDDPDVAIKAYRNQIPFCPKQ